MAKASKKPPELGTDEEGITMGWELVKHFDLSQLPNALDWAFICGVGRTGSSILRVMLNEHRDIVMTNEAGIPYCLCYSMFTDKAPLYEGGPFVKPLNGLMKGVLPRILCETYRAVVAPNAKIFGDKLWAYGNDSDKLAKIFPRATFILTVREYKSWLASVYLHNKMFIGDLDNYIHSASSYMRARRENYDKVMALNNCSVVVVNFYDDICNADNLARILLTLCDMWGLEPYDEWLDYCISCSPYIGEGKAFAQTNEFERFLQKLWQDMPHLKQYLLPCDEI